MTLNPILKHKAYHIICLLLLICVTGCSHMRPGGTYPGWSQTGTASWYGEDFHGKKTANGETYNMYGISAAHKTLPLGTRCRVTNLENGKTVTLKINDRGPYVGRRIIDLSYGAAKKIGMVEAGLAKVRIDALDPQSVYDAAYTLQFGAYTDKENALCMVQKLQKMDYKPVIASGKSRGVNYYRVQLGRFKSMDKAKNVAKGFDAAGYPCMVTAL